MSERVKMNAEFLPTDLLSVKNKEIFEETGLPTIIEEVVTDSRSTGRILYQHWDSSHHYSKISVVEDFLSPGIKQIPCNQIDEVKKHGQIVFEALVVDEEILIKDFQKTIPLPKMNKEELKDFVFKKINGKEEREEKEEKLKRFNLKGIKFIFG